MVRISKEYDERKKEIMETAMKLFIENGYEETPVSLIISNIGISKGTFYYYFKSKEELLDEIVRERSLKIMDALIPIVNDSALNALEKISLIFTNAVKIKADMKEELHTIYRVWMDDKYLLIRHKMEERNILMMVPEIKKVVLQGINEKSFNLPQAEGVAELILKLGTVVNDKVLQLFNKYEMRPPVGEIIDATNLFQMAMERVLGAPEGSIKIFDTEAMVKAFSYE